MQPEDLPDDGKDEYDEITKIVYPKYQSAMRAFRAYDFDDLVCEVGLLWKRRPDVLARWQESFRYILVDEYQDTNRSQMEVLRQLCAPHKNLCVVGDDDQAIYAWRGADVENILSFEEHFPGAKVIKLEQNYRSRAPVLDVANAVISKKLIGHQKTLFTDKAGGDLVQVRVAATPQVEAEWVSKEIKRMIRDLGKRPKDFAVLYRSNGQSKDVEEALREQMIAHKVVGGQTFFERKEVKDLLSYLKLTLNRSDEIALRRVINYPPRGIGEQSVEKLALNALGRGWTLWQAVERVDALDDIPPAAREGCKALERVMARDAQAAARRADEGERGRARPVRAGRLEARHRGELAVEQRGGAALGERRGALPHLRAARDAARGGAGRGGRRAGAGGLPPRAHLADERARRRRAPTWPSSRPCTAPRGSSSTRCSSSGARRGSCLIQRTLETRATDAAPQDVEEERRLFYVGVTRARERLYLSQGQGAGARGASRRRGRRAAFCSRSRRSWWRRRRSARSSIRASPR